MKYLKVIKIRCIFLFFYFFYIFITYLNYKKKKKNHDLWLLNTFGVCIYIKSNMEMTKISKESNLFIVQKNLF